MSILINSTKVTNATSIAYVSNPKRYGKKAWARYEEYQTCSTIGEYIAMAEKQYAMADLRYDLQKGFLKIVDGAESTPTPVTTAPAVSALTRLLGK